MRPGTEAVPNIAAFAKACEIRMAHFDEDYAHCRSWPATSSSRSAPSCRMLIINGEGDIPHVVNLSMPGCKVEVMLHVLEGTRFTFPAAQPAQGKQAVCSRHSGLPKAHGQRAARVVCTVQHKGRCGCVLLLRSKRRAKMFRR